MSVVRGDGAAGYMARRLMLAALGVPLVLGWIVSHGKMVGMYDSQFGEAIAATAYIAIFVFFVWLIGRSLIKLDAERKQAEETLRQTSEYLQNLVNYANAPIIVWDTSFIITQFNHAFENLSGYSAEEVIGKKIDVLFPKEQIESSLSLIKELSAVSDGKLLRLKFNGKMAIQDSFCGILPTFLIKRVKQLLRQSPRDMT